MGSGGVKVVRTNNKMIPRETEQLMGLTTVAASSPGGRGTKEYRVVTEKSTKGGMGAKSVRELGTQRRISNWTVKGEAGARDGGTLTRDR